MYYFGHIVSLYYFGKLLHSWNILKEWQTILLIHVHFSDPFGPERNLMTKITRPKKKKMQAMCNAMYLLLHACNQIQITRKHQLLIKKI